MINKNINSKNLPSILIVAILGMIALTGYFVINPNAFPFRSTSTQAPTGDIENWKTYRSEEYGLKFKYPSNWKESPRQPTETDPVQEIQDGRRIFSFFFTNRINYNNETGKPFKDLQEYANMPYAGKLVYVGGQEGMQYLPRAGSEHIYEVIFFSKDLKDIFTIKLITNTKTEEQIQEGQKIFNQILSTFRFLDENENEQTWQERILECINPESFLWSKITDRTTAVGNELKINVESFDTRRGCLTLPDDLFPRAQRTITQLGNATLGYVSNWDEACEGRYSVSLPNNCTGKGYQANGQGTVVFQAKSTADGVPDLSVEFTVK